MNENSKTLAFAAAGVVALSLGWFASRPASQTFGPGMELGKQFFPEFTEPAKVAGAEIIDFDSSTDTKHDLKVARVDGVWQINPEKQGYPEVSTERLADVINAVGDLKKLSVVSDDRTKHRLFGVVDPGSEAELKEGTEGVGKRIELLDEGRRAVVKLIIGKADDKDNPKLHYVRQPDRDPVYRTEIEADKLSSRFDDWVQPDLLKASGDDLRFVAVNDYGIDLQQQKQPPIVQGGVMFMQPTALEQVYRAKAVLAKKPSTKPGASTDEWQVDDFQTYDKEKKAFVERKIADDEQVETSKLSTLGSTLGGIKIVDVVRKPKVLAEDLRGDVNFFTNPESPVRKDRDSITELIAYGFQPTLSRTSDEARLICFEGEMTAGFANGVEYLLRFGDITGKGRAGDDEKKEEAKPDAAKADDAPVDGAAEGSNTAPNRYLFVTARFNESMIPKPKLTVLPLAETPKAEEKKPEEAAKTPEKTPVADAPGSPKPEEKKPEEKKPADAPKEPTKVDADDEAGSCDQEPAKVDAEKKEEPTKTDAKPADDKAAPVADAPGSLKPDVAKPDVVKPAMTPEERKRIETENQQAQEKYDAEVKAGREKAKELNAKFADWFYVVSDSTYQSLNVDPAGLIKKSTPAAGAPPATKPGMPGLPNFDLLPTNP